MAGARTSEWDVAARRARLAAGRLAVRALNVFTRRAVTTVPSRILFAPETLADADPAVAEDIYAGVFSLAGEVVDTAGASPFDVEPPSDGWARALHGFAWLAHLDASQSELSSTNARALFDDWLASPSAGGAIATDVPVMATRIASWLAEAPLLLNGAPTEFRQRYLRALGRQLRRLERALSRMPPGLTRLQAAAALALSGVCVESETRLQRIGLSLVAAELSAQVLPDGGHRSRSPAALLAALSALVPLREALVRRRQEVPPALGAAMDRMMPMLRLLSHGDGGLAAFHGASPGTASAVAAVLAFDDLGGEAAPNARYSGIQRLSEGEAVVILDTGGAPPPGFGDGAHASALAFEFSIGPQRLVINCGPLGVARADWAGAARESAAHSTLVLDGVSSARIVNGGPLSRLIGSPALAGPTAVTVERDGSALTATHDGYRPRYRLDHTRQLALAPGGLLLEGEDRLVGEGRLDRLAYAVRFHLAPGIRVQIHRARRHAVMTLPDGALWVFTVDEGPDVTAEESIAIDLDGRARRTVQLVLGGNALTDPVARWSFARHAAPLADEDDAPLHRADADPRPKR